MTIVLFINTPILILTLEIILFVIKYIIKMLISQVSTSPMYPITLVKDKKISLPYFDPTKITLTSFTMKLHVSLIECDLATYFGNTLLIISTVFTLNSSCLGYKSILKSYVILADKSKVACVGFGTTSFLLD